MFIPVVFNPDGRGALFVGEFNEIASPPEIERSMCEPKECAADWDNNKKQ